MSLLPSSLQFLRAACFIAALASCPLAANAAAPDANNDDLTSTPIDKDETLVIDQNDVLGNDNGTAIAIKSVDVISDQGAEITWNSTTGKITYNPATSDTLRLLDNGESDTDTFTYTIEGTDGPDATATVTVEIDGKNTAPTVSGIPIGILDTDDKDTTNAPFTGIDITDPDTIDILTVTVTIIPADRGTFSNATDFVVAPAGTYTFTGSAADATTKVAALNFVPTENRITVGTSDSTTINVSVDDGIAPAAEGSRSLTITSVNDVPIVDAGANRNMNDNAAPLTIFSNVTFTDPDFQEALDVTITYNGDKGTFSGSGFTISGSGANTMLELTDNQSVANAQAALRALTFKPTPNQVAVDETENLTFRIQLTDIPISIGEDTLTLAVLSINDAPVLAPATVGPFQVSSGSTFFPYGNITLTDVDFDDSEPTPGSDPGSDDDIPIVGDLFSATIVITPSSAGSILSSSFTSSTAGTYTFQSNRVQVENAIRAASYLAPGIEGTFQIALTVVDSSGKSNNASNTVTASVEVESPVPGMTGLLAGQQISDNSVIFPFASASFNNFGGFDRLVEITLDNDAKGEFDILGPFVKSSAPAPFTYSMTGSSVAATDAIRNLRFRPTPNRITGTSEPVNFSIKVYTEDGTSELSEDPLIITVTPFNDPPTITGATPEIRIDDNQTANPFAALTVSDVDENGTQPISLVITLIGEDPSTNAPRAGGGKLEAPATVPGATISPTAASETVTLTGTPAAVTTLLRSLVFTPSADRNAIGERETIRFTLIASDGKGGNAQNQDVIVIVTSVNGAPVITGVPALSLQPFPVPASGNDMTMPFADLTVDDEEDSITFTISLDDENKGTLSTDVFTDDGDGVYSFTGSPAAVTTALQAITYTLDAGFAFPVDQPGLTTFTLTATDSINTTVVNFTLFIRERNVAHIVTTTADSGPGSLRKAIHDAGNGDSIVFDFPVDDFPVTLAIESPLNITKNLSIIGSGVGQLTISGQNITGIFYVSNTAHLTLEQLTLSDGNAPNYGGAVAVDSGGALTARFCEFSSNTAGQFGGAVDIFEGGLTIENCLFVDNEVTGSTAKSGGAISVYSEGTSSIVNSTFVGNRQDNGGGDGGGAIYAQSVDPAFFFNLNVEHCTFLNNEDTQILGTAILSASAGTFVHLRNNIFADEQGQVIDVLGGGRFVSHGGNIATDGTLTTFTVNSQNITLLDHPTDRRSTDPLLGPLADNSGATRTCLPLTGSPAIGNAVAYESPASAPGTDQRGYWRGTFPRDIGAVQTGTFKRININEIHVNAGIGDDFIEFYNPRDSDSITAADFPAPPAPSELQLWIDGTHITAFTPQPLITGAGFAWTSTVDLNPEKGRIELRNSLGQRILLVDYFASFAENGVELITTGQSINRYPRYEGGFLPHGRVSANITGSPPGNSISPGADVDGSPLGGGNAPPIAVADVEKDTLATIFQINADQTLRPDLLANDVEFDRTDTLRITEVTRLAAGTTTNAELLAINGTGTIAIPNLPTGINTTITPLGATVTIDPDGRGITYDPTTSPIMIGLAKGETITDVWAYTIRDFDESNTPQSRGADPAAQEANIIKATAYFVVTITGVNEAPVANEDFAATSENQAIRLLADVDLLAPAPFNFGDLPANFQDFDASGNPVTLLPPPPTVSLLANDDDIDSDDTTTTILLAAVHTSAVPANTLTTTSELGATVTLDIRAERRETSVLYDPRSSETLNALSAGEIATDSFHYTIVDQHGATGIAKVSVTVTGVNDVPTARDDGGFVTNQNASLAIAGATLLANDTDPDQDTNGPDDLLAIAVPINATSTLGAALSFDGTTINYDPTGLEVFDSLARNETITDTFTYTATDANGGTSTATVTLAVEGRNDAPVAANDLLEILENATTTISAVSGLLTNDADVDINGTTPDDDPWVIPQRGVTTPLGAALDIHPDGSYRYDANSRAIDSLIEDELAVETFPYTVVDNFRTQAADDHFRVLTNATNVTLPVLLNDVVVGTYPNPILGYSNDDGTLIIQSPNHSLRDGLLIRLDGYVGDGDYNGVHPITAIDRDHFSIPVPFSDDPPATRGNWIPWFAITNISPGSHGGLLVPAAGQFIIYTPTPGFYGIETFTYTLEDGVGGQDVSTVSIEVVRPQFNGLLSADNDRFRIGMGTTNVAVNVLANDGILPAGPASLTITAIAPVGGATGTLNISAGTSLTYTPPHPTFTGTETFTYTITAGGTVTAQATVTFDVVDRTGFLNGAQDDFFVVIGSSNNLLSVLSNDPVLPEYPVANTTIVAIDGSPTGGATGSGGTTSIVGNQISYTPPAAILTDTFNYTARDASGATVTRTARVRVVPSAVNFFAINDTYTVSAGKGPVTFPVLFNDGTVLNSSATLEIVNIGLDTDAPPDVSRVSILNGNAIQYTPPAGATTETFTYEISIGTLDRREATITVHTIEQFNTLPKAEPDLFHVAKNAAPQTLDVRLNDIPYPAAGWDWEIFAVGTPSQSGGTATITPGGTAITYTPADGFFGTETFTYAIRDTFGKTSTSTVTVRVGEMLTAPDHFAVLQDSPAIPMPVLANDDLLINFAADYTISAVPPASIEGGTVAISGAGPNNHVTYTPPAGFTGEDTFTYTVADKTAGTRTETVTVTVIPTNADRANAELRVEITGVNDVPVIVGTADGAITDKETIHPFLNVDISDLDEWGDQQQTVIVSFNAAYGSVSAPGMTQLSPGVFRAIGTPAQVTAALRAILFTPLENFIDYIDPGQDDLVFNLSVDDGYVPVPVLSDTVVTITPINDVPVISAPIAPRTVHINSLPISVYLPDHFSDVDDEVLDGEIIWTVTANTNPALFSSVSVNPAIRSLVLAFAPDQPGIADITVRGTDRGLLFVENTFRVTVEGPPVVVLAAGQTQPPAATFVSETGTVLVRDYRQAFRVQNNGTLPVSSFVVHVTNVDNIIDDLPVLEIGLIAGQYSTNENGTLTNFNDDTRSATGVSILQKGEFAYDVKYDVAIPPGGSTVVHLTYRALSLGLVQIQPSIRISLSTPGFAGGVAASGIGSISRDASGAMQLLGVKLAAGRNYRIQSTENLENWMTWPLVIPAGDFPRTLDIVDDGQYTGTHPTDEPQRFYRLIDVGP